MLAGQKVTNVPGIARPTIVLDRSDPKQANPRPGERNSLPFWEDFHWLHGRGLSSQHSHDGALFNSPYGAVSQHVENLPRSDRPIITVYTSALYQSSPN